MGRKFIGLIQTIAERWWSSKVFGAEMAQMTPGSVENVTYQRRAMRRQAAQS